MAERSERRKAKRVKLAKPMPAKIKTYFPARVLNVSSTGALIELVQPLQPKIICAIRFLVEGSEIQLPALVRHCTVGAYGKNEKGQKVILYHAGLSFEDPDRASLDRLRELVALPEAEALGREEGGAAPGGAEDAPRIAASPICFLISGVNMGEGASSINF